MLLQLIRDLRRVWRYQSGNQNPYIEEEKTTQWPKEKVWKNKQWASDCCLMLNEQYFNYIIVRTSHIWQDDNDVHFMLDQHTLVGLS
jgi:hypothetical protein